MPKTKIDLKAAESSLSKFRRQFEKTGNSIEAWQAYKYARRLGVPVPGWVLDYFDACSFQINELYWGAIQGKKVSDKQVIDAVGLKGFDFKKHANWRWLRVGLQVQIQMSQGTKEIFAVEEAARKYGISAATARRDWMRYLDEHPDWAAKVRNFKK